MTETHASKAPLRFTFPGQFTELPLDEDPEIRVRRTYEAVSARMPDATDAERVHRVFLQEFMLYKLLQEEAVWAALCVGRSEADPAMLGAAQFAIFVKDVKLEGDSPLAAVAGGLKEPGKPLETSFVQFPAGEGLVVGEELRVDIPITLDGRRERNTHIVRQAQVMIPFPNKRRLAIISASSESLGDWIHYANMLNDIAQSVSFTEESTAIRDRLSAAL